MNKLSQAYYYMIQLINQGLEYPEAHTQACMKYDVDGDELTRMYDEEN